MNSVLKGIALTFLLLPSLAGAAVRYVDPLTPSGCSGNYSIANRNCSGSAGNSYATIAAGVNATSAGDILNIRAGTYNEAISNVTLTVRNGTNYGDAPVFQAYNGESVILTGGGTQYCIQMASLGAGNDNHYIIFKDLICEGVAAGFGGNNAGAVDHIKVDNVTVQHISGAPASNGAFTIGGSTGVSGHHIWVINSKCDGIATGVASANQYHCFYVQTPNNLFENNEIVNIPNGYGIHNYDEAGGTAHDNIYRNNNIHSIGIGNTAFSPGCAVLLNGANNQFYNNRCWHSADGVGTNAAGTIISNNSFDDIGFSGCNCVAVLNLFGSTGVFVRNNIIGTTTATGQIDTTSASGFTISNNLCPSAGTGCLLTGNPLYTSPNTGNFNLQVGSIAIDRGIINIAPGFVIPACSGGTITYCYNGTAPDMGAFETGVPSVGGTPPTLTPNPPTGIIIGMAISAKAENDDGTRRVANVGDYVGLYVPGAASTSFIDWFYMNGSKTAPSVAINDALILFTAPSAVGSYEFRFYQNGSTSETDRLATAAFTVGAKGLVFKYNGSSVTKMAGTSQTVKVGVP